jgi:hypothetical protein
VVAGRNTTRPLARLAQELLHDVIAQYHHLAQRQAVDQVADEVERVAVVRAQEVERWPTGIRGAEADR